MHKSFGNAGALRIDRTVLDLPRLVLVAALFALYAGLGARGYGNDNDTYHMLNTWNVLWSHGVYEPSRNTGYLVPEMAIGLFSSLGGHLLSNAAISMLAAAVLWLFFGTVQCHVDRTTAVLATLAVGLHPLWIIAASTSMDYLYSLSFFAFGVWAIERRSPRVAALLFGLSISARLTFVIAVLAVYAAGFVVYRDPTQRRGMLLSLAGTGALAALIFVPALIATGGLHGFLTIAESQPFSLLRAGANDALKQLVFWGVPALALVGLYLAVYGPRLAGLIAGYGGLSPSARFLLLSGLMVFAWFEAFFLRLPAEAAYLLPAMPALVLVIALGRAHLRGHLARAALVLLVCFEIIHGLVRLDIFRFGFEQDQPITFFPKTTIVTVRRSIPLRSHAGATASLGLYVEEGPLVEDASRRREDQAKWTRWLRETWPHHPG